MPGVERVESIDQMPLVWAIDDALLALDKLPAFARNLARKAAKRTVKNVDLKSSSMTVGAPSAPPGRPRSSRRSRNAWFTTHFSGER